MTIPALARLLNSKLTLYPLIFIDFEFCEARLSFIDGIDQYLAWLHIGKQKRICLTRKSFQVCKVEMNLHQYFVSKPLHIDFFLFLFHQKIMKISSIIFLLNRGFSVGWANFALFPICAHSIFPRLSFHSSSGFSTSFVFIQFAELFSRISAKHLFPFK